MGRTALILAAAGGHLEIVDALPARGAKSEDRHRTGHTALHWAAMRGRTEVVSGLLGKGQADLVRLLLSLGANLSIRDGKGRTPIVRASI